ncbi:hypothetical protein PINS_up000376 [Pythium insidiosum]|nr:hypothetical protein PINS_up000376 [Pythium insidiosum]
MEALFADSVPVRRRSGLFTIKFVLASFFTSLGPISVSLLLQHFGSEWSLSEVRPVLVAGAVIALVAMGALFQLNDDDAIENRQRRLLVERQLQSIERNFDAELSDYVVDRASICEDPDGDPRRFSLPFNVRTQSELTKLINKTNNYFTTSPQADLVPERDQDLEAPEDALPVCCGVDSSQVPFVLFAADFLSSNAAGLTADTLPLFLSSEMGMSPASLEHLFVALPLCTAAFSLVAQPLSRCCGRMPIVILLRLGGIICLLVAALTRDVSTQAYIFVLRGSLLGCTEPLRRSVLMDYVRQKHRARWNSLEGLTMFSWAGSTVIGATLVATYGYRVSLVVASLLYIIGTALDLVLVPITRPAVDLSGLDPRVMFY